MQRLSKFMKDYIWWAFVLLICLCVSLVFQTCWWTCWVCLPVTASQWKSWSFSLVSYKEREASGWVRVKPRWSVSVVWDLHEEGACSTYTAAIPQAMPSSHRWDKSRETRQPTRQLLNPEQQGIIPIENPHFYIWSSDTQKVICTECICFLE